MLLKDLTYALRTLRKSPVFAITAILTIALGIGASTAIFSVTNAVLLRPLPYHDPDRLVFAITDMQKRNVKDFPFSNANYIDLRNGAARMFDQMAAVNTGRATVPGRDGTPEQIRFGAATPNFFPMLGAKISIGRDFQESDGLPPPPQPQNATPGAQAPPRLPAMVILSYQYWQRRFGGDPAVIGQGLPGRQQAGSQIVGVLAPGFELFFPHEANMERVPDVWFAARLAYDNVNRNNVQWRVIGRLKDGVTIGQAQSSVNLVSAELRKNYVIMATSGLHIRLEPMHQHVVEEVRPALITLFGAVTFLLLIACANVANLLLVRASLRERELAVRTALGASGWRLAKQILAEAALLAGLGTLAGLALAWFGIHELLVIAPANLPRLDSIHIDPLVVGFAALAGLVAAGIFGMFPAWRASRSDVNHILRGSGRTASLGGGHMLRNGVVVIEVALSFVLLIGSGLMVRSFIALQGIDPGYDPRRILTFVLLGGRQQREPAARAASQRAIENQLRSIPGVESVTAAFPFPLAGGFSPIRWGLESALTDPTKFQAADLQIVLPGYFEMMRTRLIAGRTFTEADNAPDRKLVIIDQFLAAKAFPNQSAVGKRLLQRAVTPEPEWVEVIGVVGHQRESSLAEPGREQIYYADGFFGHGAAGQWAIRTTGDPSQYASAVRAAIAKTDGQYVITELQPMEALVEKAQAATRFELLLIGVFAVIAAFLAAVGLYGVLSTVVRQRTAEIGVRMAFGAEPLTIFKLMVGQGLSLSAAGIGVGLIAALGLTRLMATMLVGIKATDPVTFAGMVVLFFAIAAIASWLPARRAAALDPTVALRDE